MRFLKKPAFLYLIVVLGLDALFFGFTDPAKVASIWLVVAYVLALATLYWVIRGAVGLASLYSAKIRAQNQGIVKLLTVCGGIVLALQSTGQLSPKDIAILIPLVILGYFYFSYGRKGKQQRA